MKTWIRTTLHRLAAKMIEPLRPAAVFNAGLFTLFWGLWTANPFWQVFNDDRVYRGLSELFPEWFWGVIAILSGTCMLLGLFVKSYKMLLSSSAVAGWFWTTVGIFLIIEQWRSPLCLVALMATASNALIYLNLRINKSKLGLKGSRLP